MKRTRFVEYQHRYANYAVELSDDGVPAPLDRAWDDDPWST